MTFWLDAQLSPTLAEWIHALFSIKTVALKELGLRDAEDNEVFQAARNAGAIVITKDSDFVRLLEEHGPPPQICWITCGNTSNANLRRVLASAMPNAIALFDQGEPLVEIGTLSMN